MGSEERTLYWLQAAIGKAKRRLSWLQSAISVNCLGYNNNKKSEVLIVFVTISNEKCEASTKQ